MKTSNKLLLTVFILIIIAMISGLFVLKHKTLEHLKNKGEPYTVEHEIASFDRIEVTGNIALDFTLDTLNTLAVTTDTLLHEALKITIEEGVLSIVVKYNYSYDRVICKLSGNMFNQLTTSSGARFLSDDYLHAEELKLNSSSGSRIKLSGHFEQVHANVTSGARLELAGEGKSIQATVTSGSFGTFDDFPVSEAEINAKSGALIQIHAEELSGNVSSGAVLQYNQSAVLKNMHSASGGVLKSYN